MQDCPPTPSRVLQQEDPEHEAELGDLIGRGVRDEGLSSTVEVAGVALAACVKGTEGGTCSGDVTHVVVRGTRVVTKSVIERPPPH